MPRVLIVSPHFPPINAPDHQRIRMALPYLDKCGWQPTVLSVEPRFVEGGVIEPLLEKTIPADVETVRVGAVPYALTRAMGAGNLALRSLPKLWGAGNRILHSRKFDLVFFSTTQFPVMILGPIWKQKFGVPYVVDFQDPWFSDYYIEHPDKPPPGGRLKYGFSQWLAKRLEPTVVRAAAQIVCVSDAYVEMLLRRYADLGEEKFTVLAFGAPEFDFVGLEKLCLSQSVFDPRDGREHWVYVGRGGDDMAFAVRAFFVALKQHLDNHARLAERLRVHFVGTDYAPTERARKTIEPLARECGVPDIVTEETRRLPYFETLRCLRDADALLIPGSDDPGYTASKLYPYILAKKPLLAVFHEASSVVDILRRTGAGTAVTFRADSKISDVAVEILQQWFLRWPLNAPAIDWAAFAPYTAKEMTRQLCAVFDRAADQKDEHHARRNPG